MLAMMLPTAWFLSGMRPAAAQEAAGEGACAADPLNAQQLDDLVMLAHGQFVGAEGEALQATAAELLARIPCISAPLTPEQAARLHLVLGEAAYKAGDRDTARLHFAAARHGGEAFPLDESRVSPGHPLRDTWFSVDLATTSWSEVPPPPEGSLSFDGRWGRARPEGWPSLVQWVDMAGSVRFTVLLPTDQPLPAYPGAVVAEADPPEETVEEPGKERRERKPRKADDSGGGGLRLRWGFLAGAGGALAVGGAAAYYAMTLADESQTCIDDYQACGRAWYPEEENPKVVKRNLNGELVTLASQNHLALGVAMGAGGLAVGLLAFSVRW